MLPKHTTIDGVSVDKSFVLLCDHALQALCYLYVDALPAEPSGNTTRAMALQNHQSLMRALS